MTTNREQALEYFLRNGQSVQRQGLPIRFLAHTIPLTYVFEDGEKERTVGKLVEKLSNKRNWSDVKGPQSVDWYQKIQDIQDNWDFDKYKPLLLTQPLNERNEYNRDVTWCIFDGCHTALALFTLLVRGKIKDQNVHCYISQIAVRW